MKRADVTWKRKLGGGVEGYGGAEVGRRCRGCRESKSGLTRVEDAGDVKEKGAGRIIETEKWNWR